MPKCPKCGVGEIYKGGFITITSTNELIEVIYNCNDIICGYTERRSPTQEDVKEHKDSVYQQRLDNVLKHFEKSNEFYWKPILTNTKDGILVSIYHENETFYLECRNTYAGNKIQNQKEISLNTVEALLKDLGVMK